MAVQLGSIGSLDFVNGKVVVSIGYANAAFGDVKLVLDIALVDLLSGLESKVSNPVEKGILDAVLAVAKTVQPAA